MDRLDPIDSMDKRHFSRVPFDAMVTVTFNDIALNATINESQQNNAVHKQEEEAQSTPRALKGTMVDISLKGLLLELDDESLKNLGGTLDELAQAKGSAQIFLNNSPIEMTAQVQVTHGHEKNLGFVITQMPIETIQHLKQLVLLNIGDDQILQRELHSLIQSSAD